MGGMLPHRGDGQGGIALTPGCGQASRARSRQGRRGRGAGSGLGASKHAIPGGSHASPAGIPARNPAKRVPSPASPSPPCHTAAAQAPRHHRVIYFHQLPGHFSLRQDQRLIDWNLLKTN